MACNSAPPRVDPTYAHLRTREPPLYEMPHMWYVFRSLLLYVTDRMSKANINRFKVLNYSRMSKNKNDYRSSTVMQVLRRRHI